MTEPQRVTANGVDFAYLEAGPSDGPLALCLHGFPDHAPTWEHLMPELAAAGYHVVAPWLRGYSPTGRAPDDNYQVAASAGIRSSQVGAWSGKPWRQSASGPLLGPASRYATSTPLAWMRFGSVMG